MSPLLIAACWFALTGCGGWHRVDPTRPEPQPLRQQFQVWRGGHQVTLHALAVRGDSLSGVPFTLSPSCDSCRLLIPLAEIDSVRQGSGERTFMWMLAPLAVGFVVLLWFSTGYGRD